MNSAGHLPVAARPRPKSSALGRIAAHDGELRAFIALFSEAALQAAHAADDRRRRSVVKGPLDGIPFAVKDLFEVEAYPTMAGSKALSGGPATTTASAIRRLIEAGMVLLAPGL